MPNIIQSFRQPNPIADTLRKLGDSFFGDQLTPALKGAQYQKLQLENQGAMDQAKLWADPNSTAAQLLEASALSGRGYGDTGEGVLVRNANTFGARDPRTTNAGAGVSRYGQTAEAFDVGERNTTLRNDADNATSRANNADTLANDYRQFIEKVEPAMVDGQPGFVPQGRLSSGNVQPIRTDAQRSPIDDMRDYLAVAEAAGMDPESAKAYAVENAGKRGGVTVNNVGQNEYEKTRQKGFAETANAFDAEELKAVSTLDALSTMEAAVADPNFYSGFGAEQALTLRRAAVAFGADPSTVTSTETFNAAAKKAALDNMGGSLGVGFSNADREFVIGQVPALANTPQGNQQLIGLNRKIQQRKIEVARMARDYEAKHGRIDNGFMQELSAWAASNPLFPQQPAPLPGAQPGMPDTGGWTTAPNSVRIRLKQ